MAGSPDVMTKEELNSVLHTKWAGREIHYYDVTDSTNLRIRQAADDGAPHGTLAVADCQTAGRGRRGRSWESPAGSSIYMSILLRPEIAPIKASMLTLVMACSVAEGITRSLEKQPDRSRGAEIPSIQIKWPNDIIINGKKLAGILTEMSAQVDYINYVTVGVGINVNQTGFPEEICSTAASLRMECGHALRRAPIIAAIMERLEENYAVFLKTEDLTGLMEQYSSMLVNRGRDVQVIGEKETYRAHALGITPTGELVVRREDGTEEEINAGEVSVRGVYGYV